MFGLGHGNFIDENSKNIHQAYTQQLNNCTVLQWLPKETEDDVSIRIRLSKAAVVLQCWARTIVARREFSEAAAEFAAKAEFAFIVTRRIQMCFRRHRAREELRVRRMHYRNACILQKFARRKVRGDNSGSTRA